MSSRFASLAIVVVVMTMAYVGLAAANPMGGAVHGDGYYTYLWARSIVFDGDLEFHRDYRVCPDPWGLARAPVGDDVNYWNLGPALFWIPSLVWDRLTGHPALTSGSDWERSACIGPVAERAVFGSLLAGLLTAILGYLGTARVAGRGPAVFGAIAGGLLTPLPYYATMMLSYGHAASSFACGLFIVVWDRWRRHSSSLRSWMAMGAALGLAMLMRSQNAILVVLPFATWCIEAYRLARARAGVGSFAALVLAGALFVVFVLLLFAPQMIHLQLATGRPFDVSQGEHYMRWSSPRIANALFSTGAGLFTWSPVMYLAFVGWACMLARRGTRTLGLALLVVFALDSYVVGSVYDWWGSIGFPGRRFDMLVVPGIYGLAFLGSSLRQLAMRRRGLGLALTAALLVAVLFPWNAALMGAIGTAERIDLARPAPTHWDAVSRRLARATWRAVGNPLAWPASIPFALRWGVHPRAWDVLGSQELFYHDHQTLAWRALESTLDLGAAWAEGYVAGTFEPEPARVRGNEVRIAHAGRARVLLPLHWPELGAITIDALSVAEGTPANLRATLNGVPCGTARAGANRETLRLEVPPGVASHGVNELVLDLDAPVGFGALRLLDVNPPPTIEQHRRNAELLDARRRATGRGGN